MFKQKMITVGLGLIAGIAGCQTHVGTDALIGGAAGAGNGAVVGPKSPNRTASGAAIGGAIGAIGGGLIGNEQDKQESTETRQARAQRYDRYHDTYREDERYRDDRYQDGEDR